MAGLLIVPGLWPVIDANGDPVSGATIRFYEPGTTTPKAVYSDATLATSLGTVLTTNAGGEPTTLAGTIARLWWAADGAAFDVQVIAGASTRTWAGVGVEGSNTSSNVFEGDGVTNQTTQFLAAMNAAAAAQSILYLNGIVLTAPVVVPSGLVGIKGLNGSSVDGIKIVRADYGNGAKLFDATNRNNLILEGWTLDIDDVIFTKAVTTNGAFGLYAEGGTDPVFNDLHIIGFARHHFFLNGIARTNIDGLTITGRSVPVTVSAMTRAANVVTATATAHGRVTGEEMALLPTNNADVTYTEFAPITVINANTFTYPCPGSTTAATGGGVAHFRMGVGLYTQNAMSDGVYNNVRFLGLFTYGFVWGGGVNERAYNIRCEGTAVFGISMGACFNSSITGGWVKNSMYEAFQMTNCRDKCYMTDIFATWDNNRGKDFGGSINGLTSGDGLGGDDCWITDFMFVNAYKSGAAIANNMKASSFFDGTLENCGVRYTADNPGDTDSSVTYIGAAEADSFYNSSVCSNNSMRDILIKSPAGTVPLAFAEKVSASRTVSSNSHSGLQIVLGVTAIDKFVASSGSWGVDSQGNWRSYSTTLLAGVANPTTATCAVRWRREGKLVVGSARWDITTNGASASDYLAFAAPLAPKASSRVETLGGQITTGSIAGATLFVQFSSSNILFRRQSSAYPGADGVGGYVSFSYEID